MKKRVPGSTLLHVLVPVHTCSFVPTCTCRNSNSSYPGLPLQTTESVGEKWRHSSKIQQCYFHASSIAICRFYASPSSNQNFLYSRRIILSKMKYTAVLAAAALASTAEAFGPFGKPKAAAPAPAKTEAPKKKSIAARVFDMDLFAPVSTQNDYGARSKKNLKQGTINAGSSYVPSGLTADEYNKMRKEAAAKKEANYQRNVAKAGKFLDYTDFYKARGTDVSQDWFKSVTRGHRMAKTKYDWSGEEDKPLWAKKQ